MALNKIILIVSATIILSDIERLAAGILNNADHVSKNLEMGWGISEERLNRHPAILIHHEDLLPEIEVHKKKVLERISKLNDKDTVRYMKLKQLLDDIEQTEEKLELEHRRRSQSQTSGSASETIASDVDTLPSFKGKPRPHAYAVVIGIESYREQLPKADFGAQDARTVGAYVTSVMGYPEENVALLMNERATRTDIEKYVESWLSNRVEKDDTVFVYFSGHGAPNPKTGDAYLMPYDGDPAFVTKTGYSVKRLYEQLGKLPAKEVVVLLDSCFSGAGGKSVLAPGARPMMLTVENPLLPSGKTVVLAASAGDQISSTYKQKGHGLLTYFFLKGLQGEADKNKDGSVDLVELFDYVKPQVSRVARREFNNDQTPQLLGSSKGVRLVEQSNAKVGP